MKITQENLQGYDYDEDGIVIEIDEVDGKIFIDWLVAERIARMVTNRET